MAGNFKHVGSLTETSFVRLASAIGTTRETGCLAIHEPAGEARAFFSAGEPQGACVARPPQSLHDILKDFCGIGETPLQEALTILHQSGDKTLGEVLIDMNAIHQDTLREAFAQLSRQSFLSLFALQEGTYEYFPGLIHLTDFTPGPQPLLLALYEGSRDHLQKEVINRHLAEIAFSAIRIRPSISIPSSLPPAEQMATKLLSDYRYVGEVAAYIPLPPNALAALLFAFDALSALEKAPAAHARHR